MKNTVFGVNMTNKEKALSEYRQLKKIWQGNMTDENWRNFCDAKRTCRLLGCFV